MSVVEYNSRILPSYLALSTDTKPTDDSVQTGCVLFETDTKRSYIYDGHVWSMATEGAAVFIGDGDLVTLGSTADVAQTGPTQVATGMSILKGLLTQWNAGLQMSNKSLNGAPAAASPRAIVAPPGVLLATNVADAGYVKRTFLLTSTLDQIVTLYFQVKVSATFVMVGQFTLAKGNTTSQIVIESDEGGLSISGNNPNFAGGFNQAELTAALAENLVAWQILYSVAIAPTLGSLTVEYAETM